MLASGKRAGSIAKWLTRMNVKKISARLLLSSGVLLLVLAAGAWLAGVRFTLTPSVPVGFYQYTDEAPRPGRLVTFCAPKDVVRFALKRGYLHEGSCPGGAEPLGKYVLATEGDRLRITPGGITVNGQPVDSSAVYYRDSRGRELPHYPFGEHVVGPDSLFMFSGHHPRSFDSRYFGPVPRESIISTARPLWTFD